MAKSYMEAIKIAILKHLGKPESRKAKNYVDKFSDCSRIGKKIVGKVKGNHGTYTVSILVEGEAVSSACSCYIGGDGGCHHCIALGMTFLRDPKSFKISRSKNLKNVRTPNELKGYLKKITLDKLLKDLKANGITQKAFANSIGMNPGHLSSIKSSELRNRFYNELGATKLACLWVLENLKNEKQT